MDKSYMELKTAFLDHVDNYMYEKERGEEGSPFGDVHVAGSYDETSGIAKVICPVKGTAYEGRNDRIEKLSGGETVRIEREPDNAYNSNNLTVLNTDGGSLGNLPATLCNALSPLLDAGYAEISKATVDYFVPLSKRSKRCKNAVLYVALEVTIREVEIPADATIILYLKSDQVGRWVQMVQLMVCDMPLSDVKKIFELYNRYAAEYERIGTEDEDFTLYARLEGLDQEILDARKKMKKEMKPSLDYSGAPEHDRRYGYTDGTDREFGSFVQDRLEKEPKRYQRVKKYFSGIEDLSNFIEYDLPDLFREHAIQIKNYYWIDEMRVGSDVWDEKTSAGLFHSYEIMEAYPASKPLPLTCMMKMFPICSGLTSLRHLRICPMAAETGMYRRKKSC